MQVLRIIQLACYGTESPIFRRGQAIAYLQVVRVVAAWAPCRRVDQGKVSAQQRKPRSSKRKVSGEEMKSKPQLMASS